MKHDKVLLLLSSTAPLIAVLGFAPRGIASIHNAPSGSPLAPPATAAKAAFTPSQQSSPSTRRYLFNGNPLDMIASIFSQSSATADTAQPVNAALSTLALPDWKAVRSDLESKMTSDEERNFRANLAKGYGVAGSPLHKIRLFDESNEEKDIRVTFYRDSASWCPYCQKIWLALEEKRIPYRVEKINVSMRSYEFIIALKKSIHCTRFSLYESRIYIHIQDALLWRKAGIL
jgi:thiol-disulfide isomerase/thioredoxin